MSNIISPRENENTWLWFALTGAEVFEPDVTPTRFSGWGNRNQGPTLTPALSDKAPKALPKATSKSVALEAGFYVNLWFPQLEVNPLYV